MLADLQISPEELKKKLNYHKEKESLLAQYSKDLRQQVANRTRDLQAAAEVMRVASSHLDPQNLIEQSVRLIRERFQLDYVALYLIENNRTEAYLRADSGEPPAELQVEQMISVGEGLVGQAMRTLQRQRRELLVRSSSESPPETCSDLAIALSMGDKVIGVLRMFGCSSEINDEAGEEVIATLAAQIAVAISNARLYQSLGEELTERKKAEAELAKAYRELKETQSHLLQQEKMASIGQLAAGVAHEINNPMGFITSNLSSLGKYTLKMKEFIDKQQQLLEQQAEPDTLEELIKTRKKMKLDLLLEDIGDLLEESLDGAKRVKEIVLNLKNFSRVDASEQCNADLNECIESTLKMVWNEIKYKASVEKDFDELPPVNCYPQQLNQVFMNLLINASHAIEDRGIIRITTRAAAEKVEISIADNGCGIPAESVSRIFEPFYTTKEVGKGTGLGLSISYDIIKKHHGELNVSSKPGQGTTFTIILPVGSVAMA